MKTPTPRLLVSIGSPIRTCWPTASARNPDYFITRGKADASLATGISAYALDSGESSVLVPPENGLTLIQPLWSPDGRFLSFDELVYMEGRGPFAYYDFAAQQYIPWNEALGFYDWSPDGEQLAYDRMTYTATGEERIYTRARKDGAEQQVSPEIAGSYAFLPVYSPDGAQLAYLVNSGGPDNVQYTLAVQDLLSGQVRELGPSNPPGTWSGPQTARRWFSAPARIQISRCMPTTWSMRSPP